MKTFIYEKEYSMTPLLCKKVINMFENEKNKHVGITIGGINKDVKDTTDFMMPNTGKWKDIYAYLENELSKNIKTYIDNVDFIDCFKNVSIVPSKFMIQKYEKNIGKYEYHNDFSVDNETNMYRVITFLWYLNDIEIGGETAFLDGKIIIKPITGKLILFPASWVYPHKGCKPLSSSKYIITGWLYVK